MIAAHTAAPWEHLGRGDIVSRHAPTCSNDGLTDIATVYLTSNEELSHANARLIAAAPDLLQALQTLYVVSLAMDLDNSCARQSCRASSAIADLPKQMQRPTEAEYQAAIAQAAAAITNAMGEA